MSSSALTVADVIRAAIASSYERLLGHAAELSATDDDEAVHQARVATRRLRSDLRTFEVWLDPMVASDLRGELRWLGAELGAVRDLDVMRARLREHAATLPNPEAEAAERVIRRLDADREAARADLIANMQQARFTRLEADLALAARYPPCIGAATAFRAKDVLAAPVRQRWRKLRHGVAKLGSHAPDEALHAVRVRAKRCRYAAEACVPVFGDDAAKFAKGIAKVQEVLGEHHDAVVAGAWLAKTAHECTPGEAYAIGMLAQVERDAADAARREFPAVWQKAAHSSRRNWM
jgi:CHAD domain-containing protein